MRVGLKDEDSRIPNLALMKISAYHKQRGDVVGFNIKDPDKRYVSLIFTKNYHGQGNDYFSGCETVVGGSGYDLGIKLPEEIEFIKPDYSLYDGMICQRCMKKIDYCGCFDKKPIKGNMFYSMGFTSRGCIRSCEFCVVPQKEGKIKICQHPKEFYDHKLKKLLLLDNSWYAKKDWFFEVSDWIIENKLKVNASQGLDVRILTEEIADQLKRLKWWGTMHFAFDNMKDEKAVRRGCGILGNAGFNLKKSVKFYVLVGFNTTKEEDKHRCRVLKELGTMPYVMPYVRNKWTKDLSRWGNSAKIFWSCDIDDYKRVSA